MANTTQTVTIRGKTSFAKILGDPVLNYAKDGKEWKVDIVIDKNTVKELKGYGIEDRVKTKENYLDGQPFLSFKQKEFRNDGSPNFPIKVEDVHGEKWNQETEIGNGSDVDVKFVIMDFGPGKKKGVYIRSVRVLKLVPFVRSEFAPLDESDPFYQEVIETPKETETPPFDTDLDDPL